MITSSLAFTALAPTLLGQPSFMTRVRTMQGIRAVALAASPTDSRFIAALENGSVRILDAAGRIQSVTLTGHNQPAYAAAFSPDGRLAVTGDEQARIIVWETRTGRLVREFPRDRGHQRGIQSITFTRNGNQILTVGKDDSLRLWNISGGHPIARVAGEPTNFYGAAFAANNAVWVGTQKEGLRLLAPNTLATAARFTLPGGQGAMNFAMNRAGTLGVTAGRDGLATVWDLNRRTRLGALRGHADYVAHVDFTPSGAHVATSSIDGNLIVWNPKTLREVTRVDRRSYVGTPVAFTGDGRFLVSLNEFDTVEVHQLTKPEPAPRAATPPARRRR